MRHPVASVTPARVRVILLAALTAATAGCGLATAPDDFDRDVMAGMCCAGPPVAFAVSPDSARILRGDTIHFYAWDCPNGGYFCGWLGNIPSNWTVQSAAAAAVLGGTTTGSVSGASTIVVRGLEAGTSTVTAVHAGNPSLSRSVQVSVVDSSAVTSIDMSSGYPSSPPIRVGDIYRMSARLRDVDNRLVHGRPTSWTISDTSVMAFGAAMKTGGVITRDLRAKKPGTVDVTATFLGVTSVVRLTVSR